jgi:acetyl esterase/lipase
MVALEAEIAGWAPATSLEEERAGWDATCAALGDTDGVLSAPVDADGVPVAWAGKDRPGCPTVVYLHGGAFALGSPWHVRDVLARLAAATGGGVLGVDYRLAPEHVYPAAHDDALTAYRWLLAQGVDPARVVLAGDSCGGTLALATALRAPEEDLPPPAGVAVVSPWADLTQSGFSYISNADRDPWITKDDLDHLGAAYLDGADAADGRVSPLFADLADLPPLLVQVGAGEVLLADALALTDRAARAGVPVTLEVWPHAVHVWPTWASRVPEGRAAIASIARFAKGVTG